MDTHNPEHSDTHVHVSHAVSEPILSSERIGVLTYKDTTLFAQDLQLLRVPNWLDGRIIGFYSSWLEEHSTLGDDACFMYAETAHMISHSEDLPVDILRDILSALDLAQKKLILMPVNSNADPTRAGGSHWSLLVYSQEDKTFRHFDSAHAMNRSRARRTAAVMKELLELGGRCNVEEAACPQQANGYDCGVYVLALLEHYSKQRPGVVLRAVPDDVVTPQHATELRKKIERLIARLMDEDQ
eukprot:TRINITY_DN7631_c0_g1_i1.p1 TRINITY_DN7631_c0_g1~~TRINITY_DN7631_c0_g1_i1.p1  ORF type:complete len:242 (+),score=62.63 TRINITY_DN7631_c0_g1_i1:286-1011(+)